MKKIRVIFSTILLMLGMVGCAGAGDYEIELINGFKVRRTSAEKVHIASPEYSYDELLIPLLADYDEGEYVTQVGHDNDRYIIAKTNLNNNEIDELCSNDKYFSINLNNEYIIFINKELYVAENIDNVINLIVKANKELMFR